jgi:hypothetical protein
MFKASGDLDWTSMMPPSARARIRVCGVTQASRLPKVIVNTGAGNGAIAVDWAYASGRTKNNQDMLVPMAKICLMAKSLPGRAVIPTWFRNDRWSNIKPMPIAASEQHDRRDRERQLA